MNKPELAYVELTLPEDVKEYLRKILNQVVKEDEFYYSPVMSHIKGDVTGKAHIKFFYGLDPSAVDNEDLKQLLKNADDVKELKLGEFMLINGYQGLYKILAVQVIDQDRKLTNLVNKIRKFSSRPNSYEFKPHITLAYVGADYSLPITQPVLKESITGEDLHVTI